MTSAIAWWESLKHGGMLIAPARVAKAFETVPLPLPPWKADRLRREVVRADSTGNDLADLLDVVLEQVCGFTVGWFKGSRVGSEWSTRAPAGETIKPRRVWQHEGGTLPIFVDDEPRLGVGRSRRAIARVLEWLRARSLNLAVLTNGHQWRLIYAGTDHDAFCEWDTQLWFVEGEPGPQVDALRRLLNPAAWKLPDQTKPDAPKHCQLLQAVLDSRKGQNELSAALGERVRQAVELLIRSHGPALDKLMTEAGNANSPIDPRDIYAAAVRTIMRMVVLMFAESRLLMPLDRSPIYFSSYSLTGLRDSLENAHARGPARLHARRSAWPRVLALFALVRDGCGHPDLSVPKYGGDLFSTGQSDPNSGMARALTVFETACFQTDFEGVMSDAAVREIIERLSYSEVSIRQGRGSMKTRVPVDFSDLQSEYIGILYEGLLDFELRRAGPNEPIVFLAIGDEPALPLSRLEAMDDAAIKRLVEKFKVKGGEESDDEEAGDEEAADEGGADDDLEEVPDETADDDVLDETIDPEAAAVEAAGEADPIQQSRERAWTWARRAVFVGGMVRKPRTRNAEAVAAYERDVDVAGKKLVRTTILPGQWYLVRWGGTRKGSGTFYTRPQLSIPTVHRTLRPLAYIVPADDPDAPTAKWTPRKPEEILALKVCDPAVGSGSFPVAALRFLTDALYRSLEHHGRVRDGGEAGGDFGGKTVIALAEGRPSAGRLDEDLLPCRPTDADFEPRLKARLRRYVVERCLYGVDLDPLAIELAKIALWIETMDRELPFSFLDHKFKCGNALVGCWFDRFRHYPVMAWEREGGDASHSTGVHYPRDARTKAIKRFKSRVVKPDLLALIERLSGQGDLFIAEGRTAEEVHDDALAILEQMHRLPPGEDGEHKRAELHRKLRQSPAYVALKGAFDTWCALWFWPAERLDVAPLPSTLQALSSEAAIVVQDLANKRRFFHWELEFPDVFRASGSGFDAVLGNPPWENMQPNPEEFFSSRNPLFRALGRLEKLRWQRESFGHDASFEASYVNYLYEFKCFANWVVNSAASFEAAQQTFIDTGNAQGASYSDPSHPFQLQVGRIFSYKLFLEMSLALLAKGGRLGVIVPSALYTDAWSQKLRELLLRKCQWEWLFGFENRDKIFDIDSRFKFNPIIIVKGGETDFIRTAFMQRDADDWALGVAERLVIPYARKQIERFSPDNSAILEIRSERDLAVLRTVYGNCPLLGDQGATGWRVHYAIEFMMNSGAALFPPRATWEDRGYRPDEYSRWVKGNWSPIDSLWDGLKVSRAARVPRPEAPPPYQPLPIPRADIPAGMILSRDMTAFIREDEIDVEVEVAKDENGNDVEVRHPAIAVPLYEGRMIGQLDFSEKGWVSGTGRSAVWREIPWSEKQIQPQYLMLKANVLRTGVGYNGPKIAYMRIASATNRRTMTSTFLDGPPAGDSVFFFRSATRSTIDCALIVGVFGTFAYDYQVRNRLGGLNMSEFVIVQTAVPNLRKKPVLASAIVGVVQRLAICDRTFGPSLLRLSGDINSAESFVYPMRDWALSTTERLRLHCILDATIAALYGLDLDDLIWILKDCDHPSSDVTNKDFARRLDPKGFWRVDKHEPPEHRHTNLTLAAFSDLLTLEAHLGSRDRTIALMCGNAGRDDEQPIGILPQLLGSIEPAGRDGWMLPETLRLADLGLGHDDRAREPQPVASMLGPRFYDWQLSQDPAESWRECELHARNLLGAEGYQALLDEIHGRATATPPSPAEGQVGPNRVPRGTGRPQTDGILLDVEDAPLFHPRD